jgi:hypothetical protein
VAPAVTRDCTSLNDWHRETEDQPGWARCEGFRFLPSHVQDAAWDDLGRRLQKQHEADWEAEKWLLYEPRKRHQPRRRSTAATSQKPAAVAFSSDDPLKNIEPRVYVEALCGVTVPSSGWLCCPLPDHSDEVPSFQVLHSHWRCFGCSRGGGIVDLGAALYGITPRGRDFWRLRDLILEALGEPVEGVLHG